MSETENRVSFEITRFDPDRDEVPKQQTYEIPVEPDWKILDANPPRNMIDWVILGTNSSIIIRVSYARGSISSISWF